MPDRNPPPPATSTCSSAPETAASPLGFTQVEDTIPEHAPEQIALLRLDTDFYSSTAHEFEHLYPRLVAGGPIIIDDYGLWKGSRKATDDYLERNGITMCLHRIDQWGAYAGVKPAGDSTATGP